MLSILVCHSYFLNFDAKQRQRAKPYPPLATLQVASLLREEGHEVALFDAMLSSGPEEYDRRLKALQPQLVVLYEDNFNFLSKMCLGNMRRAALRMIAHARRAGARVIAAGSDVSDMPDAYLQAGGDLVLKGEGLATLLQLVARLDGQLRANAAELAEGLTDVAYLSHGTLQKSSGSGALAGQRTASPQHAEMAAWDLVDMERYRQVWLKAHGHFSLNMAASVGCPFRCAWCAKPIWGNRYVQRSAVSVAREMAYLKQTYQPDRIWFADDIFGLRAAWVEEFQKAARTYDANVPFTIQTRADIVSERMAEALRGAGCMEAWLGAESGSQRVLDAMNKGTTVEEILTARARLKAAGVRVGFFIQLGYLDEQMEDILATRALIETAQPDDIGVSVAYPLPGTEFYERVREQLGTKTHWSDSGDLEMMFRGTFSSDFYRAVRDLLPDQVSAVKPADGARSGQTYHKLKRALDRRWEELMAREGPSAVAGPSAAASA
jgi:anaerobic magnesium-protoporphyrin IX monomethyl ester cyclase